MIQNVKAKMSLMENSKKVHKNALNEGKNHKPKSKGQQKV